MAILERVTITGADDSISADSLAALSFEYPYVEWGILVSKSNEGQPRYPSRKFRDQLLNWTAQRDFNLSVHVQGAWLRALLLGDGAPLADGCGLLILAAQRLQFNFHGGKVDYDALALARELEALALVEKQFLFQHDGCDGADIMKNVLGREPELDCVPFYDMSHGAGVLPERWPATEYDNKYVGYAGGLGPKNLAEQILLIAKAVGKNKFWIDMETKVRTRGREIQCLSADVRRDYDIFDLDKVKRALEICKPFIGREL